MAFPIVTKKRLFLSLGILGLSILFIFSTVIAFFYFYKGKERINFLFLGESGSGHVGATLTDTIIFFSVSSDGAILLSVPRDIWYDPLGVKINSLYSGGGLVSERKVMEEILGQKIDTIFLIDFNLFVRLVDLLDGIDVYVEGAFDDFEYPIAGKEEDLCGGDKALACRYEHLHFDAGLNHFDGTTALKFVRSRHALGDEGTDYARSRRQQKVITAIVKRIASPRFFLVPRNIFNLLGILRSGLKTDINTDELISLTKILVKPSSWKTSTFVLDGWEKAEGYLYHPTAHYSGLWVLLPQGGNWDGVHQFIQSIL